MNITSFITAHIQTLYRDNQSLTCLHNIAIGVQLINIKTFFPNCWRAIQTKFLIKNLFELDKKTGNVSLPVRELMFQYGHLSLAVCAHTLAYTEASLYVCETFQN